MLRLVDLDARNDRTEMKRRRNIIGNPQLAQFLESLQIAVGRFDHLLAVFFAEVDARHLQRVCHHLEGHTVAAGVLHPRPEHTWRERPAEAKGGHLRHETATCFVEMRHRLTPVAANINE
jgi:hypothetical protein